MQRYRWYLVVILLLAACAVVKPPSGGPEDTIAPRVVSTAPRPDSAGVARDVKPVITFSEKIDGTSFTNKVLVFPPASFGRLRARGENFEISFASPLPETTVCVVLRPGIKDYHQVATKESYTFCFATADSMDSGAISGWVLLKDQPDSSGVAELFQIRGADTIKVYTARPSRIALADHGGTFAFRGLPTNDARFLLWGWIDVDNDGRFTQGKDYDALHPDTLLLTSRAHLVEALRLKVINPKEPGSIAGRVVNETVFKIRPTLRLESLKQGERARVANADSTGNFLLTALLPGSYRLTAFIDVKRDTLCGTYASPTDTAIVSREPCLTLPDTLVLKPGEEKKLAPFTLK